MPDLLLPDPAPPESSAAEGLHIEHLEIVVLAPETANDRAPAAPATGSAIQSTRYLRRL